MSELTLEQVNNIMGKQTPTEKASSWPNDEEKARILAAIRNDQSYVIIYNRRFIIRECTHRMPKSENFRSCHFVTPEHGFAPCGHFTV